MTWTWRPAMVSLTLSRYRLKPAALSLPSCASAPVSGSMSPTLSGPRPCAAAEAARLAEAAAPAGAGLVLDLAMALAGADGDVEATAAVPPHAASMELNTRLENCRSLIDRTPGSLICRKHMPPGVWASA